MPILGVIASSISGNLTVAGSYDSIATQSLSGVSSVTFSSIPQTYSHLQLRFMGRGATTLARAAVQFNGDTSSVYDNHGLYTLGPTASLGAYADLNQARIEISNLPTSSDTANVFAVAVVDIFDYSNASKFKTLRSHSGWASTTTTYTDFRSGVWRSTSAITSITVAGGLVGSGNFATNSTVALYGIKVA